MKCPKCQYIGFDTGDRCRNCGYEFALLLAPARADAKAAAEPLDLMLHASAPEDAATPARPALPLFRNDEEEVDVPLVRPAQPRQPIAVRKTPEAQRHHLSRTVSLDTSATPVLEFGSEPPAPRVKAQAADPLLHRRIPEPLSTPAPPVPMLDDGPPIAAGLGARCVAAAIDYGLLLGIDLAVLHFTLRLTALTFADWRVIPLVPLLFFLVGVKLAYLTTFTLAGGQTIGKMATGLRVVPDESRQVAPWDAVQRALVEVASLVACGLPFLLALGDPARRGLHDRVARTRVVPAA
jgi:uncharacterized RDD family membrane protein YckC